MSKPPCPYPEEASTESAAPQVEMPRASEGHIGTLRDPSMPSAAAAPTPTPLTDAILPSQSFIDETRLFDRQYYLPLVDHARQLERALAESQEKLAECERQRDVLATKAERIFKEKGSYDCKVDPRVEAEYQIAYEFIYEVRLLKERGNG